MSTTKITLTGSDKAMLCLALRIATEQFEKDVATAEQLGLRSTQQQFDAQVKQARELAGKVGYADTVEVLTEAP